LKKILGTNWKDNSTTIEILECTKEQFMEHFELKFYPNPETGEPMTWKNHGSKGWHIDHIFPLSKCKTKEGAVKACHYTNLQPMWAKENLSKGNKIL
jgi:hypothetical protein